MGVRLSTEAIVPVSSRLTLLPPDLHNHVAHPLPQGCGKVEAPIGANPFRTKSQMVQISTQMAQIRSTFNQRGTPTSLPCRREAICQSMCSMCGFRDHPNHQDTKERKKALGDFLVSW